ncbi:TPA: hypothetical protein ACN33D_004613 [Vibrio parahaemolyticus]
MQKSITAIALASVVTLQGCSLPMSFVDDSLYVTCTAPSPTITINGQSYTGSIAEVDIPRGDSAFVTCGDEGYQAQSIKVDTGMSGAGAFDLIVGSFTLFPLLGLALPGSEALEEEEIHMVLSPMYFQPEQQQAQPVNITINNEVSK